MPLSIPKINIGVGMKKSHFDKTHDVNTTSDFGFCQPTLFDLVNANSTIKVKSNSFVRLLPMPCPSFSRVQFRTYNTFVPITDVFLAYDYLQSQQVVSSYNKKYTPSTADYITSNNLYGLLFFDLICRGFMHFDSSETYPDYSEPDNQFTSPFIPVIWEVDHVTPEGYAEPVDCKPIQVAASCINTTSIQTMLASIFPRLIYNRNAHVTDYWNKFVYACQQGSRISQLAEQGALTRGLEYLSPSFENADFKSDIVGYWHDPAFDRDVDIYITFHATHRGKRLLKVLNALQYDIFTESVKNPLYPLLAYYKAWFDLFNPARETQWKSTEAFRVIHGFYDSNNTMNNLLNLPSIDSNQSQQIASFLNMLSSIPDCCFSLDSDPFTVSSLQPYPQEYGNNNSYPLIAGVGNQQPTTFTGAKSPESDVSSLSILFLQKIFPYVGKNSVIGRRVGAYLRAHGLGGHEEERHFNFGSDVNQLQITDLFNTADTSGQENGSYLGEYAGKGEGSHSGDTHSFETKETGIFIQFSCVVPLGGYSQGKQILPCGRYDFYQKEFDSLGMEAVPYSTLLNDTQSGVHYATVQSTFGFRPRYMGFKFKTNLRNGGFWFRSERDQLLPYCLDRFFNDGNVEFRQHGNYTYPDGTVTEIGNIIETPSVTVPCREELRYIGRNENFGNYNRLFYDASGNTDNFIVHMIQEYHVYSEMLPISDSFDAFDDNGLTGDKSTISVEHV